MDGKVHIPFDEALDKLLGTLFVDMPLGRLLVKDMVECEGFV